MWPEEPTRTFSFWLCRYRANRELRPAHVYSLVRLTIVLSVGAAVFDYFKLIAYHQWEVRETYGVAAVALCYALISTAAGALAVVCFLRRRDLYVGYMAYAACFAGAGLLECAIIRASIITAVWHVAIGLFGTVAFGLHRMIHDTRREWIHAKHVDVKILIEVKRELAKELHWVFTSLVAILVGFTSLFGIMLTTLFRTASDKQTDQAVTAIQMTIGYGTCAMVLYLWAGIPALSTLSLMRRTWLPAQSNSHKMACDENTKARGENSAGLGDLD